MKRILIISVILVTLFLIPQVSLAKSSKSPLVPQGQEKKIENQTQNQVQSQTNGGGNRGAIWTVNSPDIEKNVNHYLVGDDVYLNGAKIPGTFVNYYIYTNPPNPKGTLVASGTLDLENGQINDQYIWQIPANAQGVYKVVIESIKGKKSDNFLVKKPKKEKLSYEYPQIQKPPIAGEEGKVLGAKTLPEAGAKNAVWITFLSLVATGFIRRLVIIVEKII